MSLNVNSQRVTKQMQHQMNIFLPNRLQRLHHPTQRLHETNIPNTVLEIGTICHARDMRKLVRSRKQLHLLSPPDPCNLPGTALLGGFQSSCGALPVSKTVFSKCSFIWKKRPVNI